MPKKPKKQAPEEEKTDEEREFYASEEQGILPEEDSDTIEAKMEHGEKDKDIYTKEGEEKLEEDDEIEAWEEGFMQGAKGPGQLAKDALTGQPLMDIEDVVEIEIDGELHRFASEENAQKFMEEHRKGKKKRSG